jgi:hypothetical protein
MAPRTATAKRRQTNTSGASLKDRSASGPRPDGGGGALPAEETLGWVPVGGIVMYSGTFADIPANWALCDGSGSTPDLADKFVIGTATEGDIGDTGGSETHTHDPGTLAVAAHTTAADTAVTGAGTRVTTATHTFSGATAATDGRPPFYTLAFIKRVS